MPTRLFRASASTAALLVAAACDATPKNNAASNDVTWDTLPSGAVHAVYSSFPVFPLWYRFQNASRSPADLFGIRVRVTGA